MPNISGEFASKSILLLFQSIETLKFALFFALFIPSLTLNLEYFKQTSARLFGGEIKKRSGIRRL